MDVFNAVQKQDLDNCVRMRRTTEVDKIDSKRMCVDAMTKNGKVIFSEECKRLMDLRDEIGTKGGKKMRNAKLKHA